MPRIHHPKPPAPPVRKEDLQRKFKIILDDLYEAYELPSRNDDRKPSTTAKPS